MSKKEIQIRPWIDFGGGMMVNAEALDITHPDHVYNQILAQGEKPEDYGYKHPYSEMYTDKTRDELIHEIVSMRKEIEALYRESARW